MWKVPGSIGWPYKLRRTREHRLKPMLPGALRVVRGEHGVAADGEVFVAFGDQSEFRDNSGIEPTVFGFDEEDG